MYNSYMKLFRYKFSRAIFILIAIMFALGVTAFIITLWLTIKYGLDHTAIEAFTIAKYVLLFFVSVSLIIISILLVTRSCYIVGNGKLKMCFAAIPSTYSAKDIDTIINDRTTDRLSVVFANDTSINVVIKNELYNDFVQAVLKENPKVEYSIRSKTSTEDDDKKA